MGESLPCTFSKEERLCSHKALENLFSGQHFSFSAYPVRAIFAVRKEQGIRVLISVSKRHHKRAVCRNRIKRQLREAYRLNKHLLQPAEDGLDIAFLWTCTEQMESRKVHSRVQNLLNRINETLGNPAPDVAPDSPDTASSH